MKKILIGFMSLLLAVGTLGCSMASKSAENIKKTDTNASSMSKSDNKKSNSPNTIMDLFDGKQRVWFYIYDDELTYESKVLGMFITNNKNVTEFYYNVIPDVVAEAKIAENVNIPSSGKTYSLNDFVGLSDSEIIDMVSASYGDASKAYQFSTEKRNYEPTGLYTTAKNYSYESSYFPFAIQYNGSLDSSGNNLTDENLKIFSSNDYTFSYPMDTQKSDIISVTSELKDCSIIKPIEIKDKEYVGIKENRNSYNNSMIITQNNYKSFGDIKYDSPDNATKW
ncbi:MAG: hypothetical protein PUF72_04520 [Clostridiales bacterium]|nr:hypothetical protein [Clostridiales bacterium]